MLLKLNGGILKIKISFAFIALVALLYSCSGNENKNKTSEAAQAPGTKTTTGKPVDVCSLITEEEARSVLGGAVKKGEGNTSMCQYLEASDKISASGSVTIQLHSGTASEYDNYITDAEKSFNTKAKAVAGVGEKAFFVAGQLIVLTGQHFITVIVGKNISEEQVIALEKTVAQKAIERL